MYQTYLPMKEPYDKDKYPGFEFPASSLVKFVSAGEIFTILLKNGQIIHYIAADQVSFNQWLINHKIADIKSNWN
jgi:hypothetical protein